MGTLGRDKSCAWVIQKGSEWSLLESANKEINECGLCWIKNKKIGAETGVRTVAWEVP